MSIPIRLAADIGGTFTDVVLESEAGFQSTKVLTTLNQPEIGVMQGIDELLRLSNIEPGQITHVIHGTTLGTNTVIERKGAKTAFLTTEGFRDILEMGYEKRFDHYDIYLEKPPPLVPRKYRLPVRERISAEGKVLEISANPQGFGCDCQEKTSLHHQFGHQLGTGSTRSGSGDHRCKTD